MKKVVSYAFYLIERLRDAVPGHEGSVRVDRQDPGAGKWKRPRMGLFEREQVLWFGFAVNAVAVKSAFKINTSASGASARSAALLLSYRPNRPSSRFIANPATEKSTSPSRMQAKRPNVRTAKTGSSFQQQTSTSPLHHKALRLNQQLPTGR